MAASSTPRIKTFKAGGTIPAFSFVKFDTAKDTVVVCGANERAIGIHMGSASIAEGERAEVALPGGGAKLLVSETIALGKLLTSTATGKGEVADAAGEFCAAIAHEDGVANDIIGVEVIAMQAVASDA